MSGKPIDRRDAYGKGRPDRNGRPDPAHFSPHSLRHARSPTPLTLACRCGMRKFLARHADPRTTQRYERARGTLDRDGVHILTAYVAGV